MAILPKLVTLSESDSGGDWAEHERKQDTEASRMAGSGSVHGHKPAAPALGRGRCENCECKTSLGCVVKPCLRKPKTLKKKRKGEFWMKCNNWISKICRGKPAKRKHSFPRG